MRGCSFGFAFGSLRLSSGTDPLNSAADPRRKDSAWEPPNVLSLPTPAFETGDNQPQPHDASVYDGQMRHYLYRAAISQFATEVTGAERSYSQGLRASSSRSSYIFGTVEAALKNGLVLVQLSEQYYDPAQAGFGRRIFHFGRHAPNAWDGHALVGYSAESDGAGGFYIDV